MNNEKWKYKRYKIRTHENKPPNLQHGRYDHLQSPAQWNIQIEQTKK